MDNIILDRIETRGQHATVTNSLLHPPFSKNYIPPMHEIALHYSLSGMWRFSVWEMLQEL